MFSIKIAYKGKNILLPKGTDSIKKIEDELLSRFQGDFANGVALSYQGNQITEYAQIQQLHQATGSKSLKIEAEPKPQRRFSSVIREEKKPEPVEKIQIKEVEVKVEQVLEQPKIEVQEHLPVAQIPEKQLEVPVTEVRQEKENKPPQEPEVMEDPQVVDISIDSVFSDQELEKAGEEKKEIEVELEHKPEIIKCAIFGEEPKTEVEVKCTIYNELPKVEEKQNEIKLPEPEPEKEQVKQEVIKCEIYESEIEKQKKPKIQSSIKDEQIYEPELKEISPGVYECIFCRPYEVCNVCDTKRKLDQKSRFIVFINRIVEKQVNQRLADLQTRILEKISMQAAKQSEVEKPVEKKQQKPRQKNQLQREIEHQIDLIKAAFLEIDDVAENKKQLQVGDQINWTFHMKIKRQMAFRHKACLIEERTGETINVDLTNNMLIKVGPFKAEKQGKFQKTYRLCIIKDDQSMQMFGPRFGFSITITKPKVTKVLTNHFRKFLEQTKKAYKCDEKPTEYLIERLREMGINEENYEENKSLIPEIICTL